MKILIVGSDKHWAIENHFLEYFKGDSEIEAALYPAHNIFHEYYYRSIINKISFRLGLSSIYSQINKELLLYVEKFKPDILWVFKGMEIFPSTLKKIKSTGVFLANYNPDHPFEYAHKGSGNQNVLNSISLFDLHFSYSKNILDEINNRYQIKGEWLPFAYQPIDEFPPIPPKDIPKVCFIGNPDQIRAELIQYLGERGLPLDVYGSQWGKYKNIMRAGSISFFPSVFQEAFAQTAVKYRVQLNIFRPQNIDSHNMRTFEMPAIGSIMLAPYSQEHLSLFENKKEAFYYKNKEEAFELAKEIISFPQEKALEIKIKAQKRSLNSGYSYEDRAKQVLATFKSHYTK